MQNIEMKMTSREIASYTGKDHKNVLRDIRNMLADLEIESSSDLSQAYIDGAGVERTEYILNESLTLTLVTGYDVKKRKAVVDRWRELEQQQTPALPMNYEQALEALLIEHKDKKAITQQRDKAVEERLYIRSKAEATAMANSRWEKQRRIAAEDEADALKKQLEKKMFRHSNNSNPMSKLQAIAAYVDQENKGTAYKVYRTPTEIGQDLVNSKGKPVSAQLVNKLLTAYALQEDAIDDTIRIKGFEVDLRQKHTATKKGSKYSQPYYTVAGYGIARSLRWGGEKFIQYMQRALDNYEAVNAKEEADKKKRRKKRK